MAEHVVDLSAVPSRWRALVAEVNGCPLVGTPGVRDALAPCDDFEPVGAPFQRATGAVSCDTDGHYLCEECVHISLAELRRRRGRCVDCGAALLGSAYLGPECACPPWRAS